MKTKTFIRYDGLGGGTYPKEFVNVLEHSMLCTELQYMTGRWTAKSTFICMTFGAGRTRENWQASVFSFPPCPASISIVTHSTCIWEGAQGTIDSHNINNNITHHGRSVPVSLAAGVTFAIAWSLSLGIWILKHLIC